MGISTDTKRLLYRRTKIVATLGPSSEDESTIAALINAGANIFRLNMSHGTHEGHRKVYERVRAAAKDAQRPVARLLHGLDEVAAVGSCHGLTVLQSVGVVCDGEH